MIPITQTVLHDPENGKFGNCFSAVLASLLHVPIATVPVFSDPQTWVVDLNQWLRQFGLAYIQINGFGEWCKENGVEWCYHEVAGASPRHNDILHACVGINGVPVFDPHPSGAGIVGDKISGILIALEPWRAAMGWQS